MANSTIVTRELLSEFRSCTSSYRIVLEENLLGKPISEILEILEQRGVQDAREWWEEIERTEKFIRFTGSVITVNKKFKVFNCFTGQYEEFLDIEIARSRLTQLGAQVLQTYTPRLITELFNEHGDCTWIDTDEHLKLQVTITNGS